MGRRTRQSAAGKHSRPRSWLAGPGTWVLPLGVAAITFITFLPALWGQFVSWDDDRNFLLNTAYRGLGPEQLQWMFTTFLLGPYQPLSWMSLGFDFVVWGMDPFGYHLTNLLLHSANAWLMYVLAVRIYERATPAPSVAGAIGADAVRVGAAAAAWLFALHPLRVESVAWVTERRDVLSGLFTLLTLLTYLTVADRKRRGDSANVSLAVAVLFFAMSLLSKASAMALPIVLLLIDVFLLRRARAGTSNPHPVPLKALLVEKIPFAALSVVAAVLAAIGQKAVDIIATMDRQGPLERIARAFYGLVFYCWKTIAPVELSNLYEVPFRARPFDMHFVVAAAIVVVITVTALLLRRRSAAPMVAWVSYAALLLPVSGIAHPGGQIVADRYSYLPCLAWALLAGGGIAAIWRVRSERPRAFRLVAVSAAAVLVALVTLTTLRIPVWRDSIALWQNGFEGHPLERLRREGPAREAAVREYEAMLTPLGNLSAYWATAYNYGTTLRNAGRLEDAVQVYARAAAVNTSNADVRNSWGATLMDLHHYDEAVVQLEAALYLDPKYAKAQFNLGITRAAQGRIDDAAVAYQRAITLDPDNPEAYYNLGVVLAEAGKLEDAAAAYRRALALRPAYAEAYNNLGVAFGRLGRLDEAIAAFRQALAINPSNASAERNLAQALDAQKRRR